MRRSIRVGARDCLVVLAVPAVALATRHGHPSHHYRHGHGGPSAYGGAGAGTVTSFSDGR